MPAKQLEPKSDKGDKPHKTTTTTTPSTTTSSTTTSSTTTSSTTTSTTTTAPPPPTAGKGTQMILLNIGTNTPVGTIGPSAPTGLGDSEVYKISAAEGEVVDIDLVLDPKTAVNDIDLYVVRIDPQNPITVITDSLLAAMSTNGAGTDEHVSFVSPVAANYYVIVVGWIVDHTNQPFTLTASTQISFWQQGYAVHTFGSARLVDLVA